jgi:AcrR family transcriptional regulator
VARTRGKEKFKAADARTALLDAGWEILVERGLVPGFDRVTLQEAVERSGVPRTTAYRVFSGPEGSLSVFREALLARIQIGLDAEPSFDLVAELLAESDHIVSGGDGAAKADLFREMIRIGFNDRLEKISAAPSWRAYISTIAALNFDGTATASQAAIKAGDRFVPLFEAMGEIFGFRPKPGLTWTDFASILVAAVDGAAIRMLEDPSFGSIDYSGDPDKPWNGASILALSLFVTWCEPDPDAQSPADLLTWTNFANS